MNSPREAEVRQVWFGREIDTALHDIKYACRSLLRSPGFTAVVVATIALGMGVNLTMFSLMRAVLWRPLPYPDPSRIVTFQVDARSVSNAGATRRELLSLQERSRSFEQVSTIDEADANLEYGDKSERVAAADVSDNFLSLLGVRPELGRLLDSRIDASRQQVFGILISDELWRRRFSADPGVIRRSIRVNDLEMQIVGVLPPRFRLFLPPSVTDLEHVDVWFPYHIDPAVPYRGLPLMARLKPGVTLEQANAELQTLATQFVRENPGFYSGPAGWQASPFDRGPGAKVRFTARLLHDDITREARPALFLLSASVVFVLLIACLNVANLMLARGSAREGELAVRRALGASRIQIVRQLLTESLLLALVSAGVGLLGAHFGLAAIAHQSASHIPLRSRIGVDGPLMLFAVALSASTSILFGLLPAWRLTSEMAGQVRGRRTQTPGAGARSLQRILVVTEVALSIVPLVCGGLMLRSFLNLLHSPLGFDPANVVTAILPLDTKRYPGTEQRWALLGDVLARLRAIPGVESASAADPLPLAGQESRRVGSIDRPDAPPILATQQFALPGYLHAIGTPLHQGRDFTDEDIATQRGEVIIDEDLAGRLWPEGAIARRLVVYRTGRHDEFEVVGVTSGVRLTRVRDDNTPHFILPYGPYPGQMSLVIKTHESAAKLAPLIEAAVHAAHAGTPVFDIRPMSGYVSDSIGDTRFMVLVLTIFAGASVLLAAVGLYGTLTYLILQRTREFGIRLAVGSSVRAIVGIVLKESALLTVVGTALGLLGASALTGVIRQMLYRVHPLDGPTLVGIVGLVGIVALAAACIPAWRAARIDPQTCLRGE